jgi:hypothetical protein
VWQIGTDTPNSAIVEVVEQRLHVDSGNFAPPNNCGTVDVSLVVDPLRMIPRA